MRCKVAIICPGCDRRIQAEGAAEPPPDFIAEKLRQGFRFKALG
jgi:hypothetical protein